MLNPPIFMLVVLLFLSPPLTSMEMGNPPNYIPLFIIAEDYGNQFGEEITPNFCRRYSKVSLGRGFVNMSTICSSVPMYTNLILFSMTYSHRKWNLIGKCLVLECITGFLEIFIALVLSKYQNKLIISNLHVLQGFLHQENMSTTCCYCDILCFCCG
jgi:hypothetical protein